MKSWREEVKNRLDTLKLYKPMKEGNEMNLLETLDAMDSLKNNKFKADLKEAIEEVSKTSNDLKEASKELHFYTYAGLANMYENVQNIIEESTETNKEIYSSLKLNGSTLEELTNDDDTEIKMLAHELIAKTIYFEAELKNYGLCIKEKMEESCDF